MVYQFTNTESVPEGIRRVVREEIDGAIHELTDREIDPHEGVHQARKRFKKIRAVLRLIRQELGEVYAVEAPRFREFGRKLSEIRDAEAMIETFDKLQERYRDNLEEEALAGVKDSLIKRRQAIAHDEEDLESRAAEVVAELHEARESLPTWPLATDSFTALSPGLQKIYRNGRRMFNTAYINPTAEHFHDWRKRVKDLWYHGRLMENIWPQLMGGYIYTLHELSEHLGDDHDLVVFDELLSTQPEAIGSERTVQMLKSLINKRQTELRGEAEKIGHRIYAEKPKNFRLRMQVYWQVWQSEAAVAN